ncbi:hypothetical protein GCM10020331_094500 [Ectobacillus funiculus]
MLLSKQLTYILTALLKELQLSIWNFTISKSTLIKIKAVYKERCTAMLFCIKEFFSEKNINYSMPEGGLFIWIELPESVDSGELFAKCLEK